MRDDPRAPSDRAEELLYRHLSPEQWRDYCEAGEIRVRGPVTGLVYRITGVNFGRTSIPEKHMNLCIYPTQSFGIVWPPADELLAKKMLLEANEPEFRQTAIASHYYDFVPPPGGPLPPPPFVLPPEPPPPPPRVWWWEHWIRQ